MRRRVAIALVVLSIVWVIGFVVSIIVNFIVFDEFDAYGEVPIPGTGTVQLPAGDVTISFHSRYPKGISPEDVPIPIPDGLEVTITPPSGLPEPDMTDVTKGDRSCGTRNSDGHCTVKTAHIHRAGNYTVTTNANVTSFPNPRVAFGRPSQFWFVTWLFGCLFLVTAVSGMGLRAGARRRLRNASRSDAALLASGERVRGVLKSFRATKDTVRSRGWTPSRPELLDAPIFELKVELELPDRGAVVGHNEQPVPLTAVPNLAIGRELSCAVDPARPAHRFVVDWNVMISGHSGGGFREAPAGAGLPSWPREPKLVAALNPRPTVGASVWTVVKVTAIGVLAAVILGHGDVRTFVAVFAVALLWAALPHALHLRFDRTHTPEERAALAAEFESTRERNGFVARTAKDKGEVLRTGADARAVITTVEDTRNTDEDLGRLVYLELEVTVGADRPYGMRTGEYVRSVVSAGKRPGIWVTSLAVGRELSVRVDPANRQRVAVDWEKSARLHQAPAVRLRILAQQLAAREISDVEYTAQREKIIADT